MLVKYGLGIDLISETCCPIVAAMMSRIAGVILNLTVKPAFFRMAFSAPLDRDQRHFQGLLQFVLSRRLFRQYTFDTTALVKLR
jgi:hypothetical protein